MRISDWSSDVCSSDLFGVGQLALEAVQQAVDDLALAFVHGLARDGLPKPRLAHDAGEDDLGAVEGAVEAADEPQQPGRNVEVTLLSRFQHVVIGFALGAALRGHAVEALRGSDRKIKRLNSRH